ncbi:MAG: DUF6259 domain-containing protein, partial [Clostridia bacterium]
MKSLYPPYCPVHFLNAKLQTMKTRCKIVYHSRKRFTNGSVCLTFDTANGELLELTDLSFEDNLIKNFPPPTHQPFSLLLRKPTETTPCADEVSDVAYAFDNKVSFDTAGCISVRPASSLQIAGRDELRPTISGSTASDGEQLIRIEYPTLGSDDGLVPIRAVCKIRLPASGGTMTWQLSLDNGCVDAVIEKVYFPSVHGLCLGNDWTDNTLIYPYFSGEKTVNPVEQYAKNPAFFHWKWQEYRHAYLYDGVFRWKDPSGAFVREMPYGGSVSMMWLDYYSKDHGFYLACHDTNAKVLSLRSETFGPKMPGMGFSIVHHPYLKVGQWCSPVCTMALHCGDWHWGANTYRLARNPDSGLTRKTRPVWFDHEPGLVAHYDFKYQCGGIVHRFSDIPELFHRAQEMGFSFLLLAGWHQDGFDCGFPEYRPDSELGNEQDLIDAVTAVHREGGHVIFYVNARLGNTCYEHRRAEREAHCARGTDGTINLEQYGDQRITFATYCANSPVWQKELADTVRYLVGTIGASGVYFDQVAMASPVFCFHPEHAHHPADWCRGYQQMFRHLFDGYAAGAEPAILYEGATDLYGAGVSGQLISTFVHHHVGAFPEMYKYTFPDQVLVDMLYPCHSQAMRPVHVAQRGREMMERAFLVGSFYWIYDLEEDNTFANDPIQSAFLAGMVSLRRVWLDQFGYGTFLDMQDVACVTPGVQVKRYALSDASILLAVANPNGTADASATLSGEAFLQEMPLCARTHTFSQPKEAETRTLCVCD